MVHLVITIRRVHVINTMILSYSKTIENFNKIDLLSTKIFIFI